MDISKDFYQILELSSDASQEELKESYRKLAKKYHPDSKDSADPHKFQLVQSAWDILGDPQTRLDYDKKRNDTNWEALRDEKLKKFQADSKSAGVARPLSGESWSYPKVKPELEKAKPNIIDRLKTIASGKSTESITKITKMALSERQSIIDQPYPEQSITVKVTPLEIWFGTKKEVSIKSINQDRKIKVKIPRGYTIGTTIKVQCPKNETYPEQLVLINLEIIENDFVYIDNLNLNLTLPITFSEAILGCEIIFPTPDNKIRIKIPAKFELGNKIKISGAGLINGESVGDLILKPKIAELPDSDTLTKILYKIDTLYEGDVRENLIKYIYSIDVF